MRTGRTGRRLLTQKVRAGGRKVKSRFVTRLPQDRAIVPQRKAAVSAVMQYKRLFTPGAA
jgi:hypothetical protein